MQGAGGIWGRKDPRPGRAGRRRSPLVPEAEAEAGRRGKGAEAGRRRGRRGGGRSWSRGLTNWRRTADGGGWRGKVD
ncbi:hypothetical protein GQ55_8G207600 [Panicum hallii var. hallii]|uniref:Uncharacterized protein n=1 Tax=Panicum hallii var. hallii TaxID=1504633 RepID=A0A2T7CPL3_9POAL|nr:hypothetical protein GQ55_8G207600 [Panicum hallii var. hallii]